MTIWLTASFYPGSKILFRVSLTLIKNGEPKLLTCQNFPSIVSTFAVEYRKPSVHIFVRISDLVFLPFAPFLSHSFSHYNLCFSPLSVSVRRPVKVILSLHKPNLVFPECMCVPKRRADITDHCTIEFQLAPYFSWLPFEGGGGGGFFPVFFAHICTETSHFLQSNLMKQLILM